MKWSEWENKLLLEYADLSAKELSTILPGRSSFAVHSQRIKIGLRSHKAAFEWNDDLDSRLLSSYPTHSHEDLLSEFSGADIPTIRRRAKILRIKRTVNIRRNGDLSPLLNGSLESLYWIGMLMADGWINLDLGLIAMSLNKKDREHLEKLATYLNTKCNSGPKDLYSIKVQDKAIGRQVIERFDFRKQKSHNPPFINYLQSEDEFFAFWAGFIDGDGCFTVAKYKGGRKALMLVIVCAGEWFMNLNDFQHRAFDYLGLKMKTSHVRFDGDWAKFQCVRKDFIDSFKSRVTSLGLPLLDRKWSKTA